MVFLLLGFSPALLAQGKPAMKFNHLAIFVRDLQQSGKFYMEVLGLDSIPEPFHDRMHLWLDVGLGGSIHVIAGAKEKKEYFQGNHICLSTSNMDAFKERLKKNKVEWTNYQGQKGQTTTRPDGVLQIWIQDPDGYNIEINNAFK